MDAENIVGALIAYKGAAAKVTAQQNNKFEIALLDGCSKKVRAKDFRYLHPNFIKVNSASSAPDFSILTDFSGETLLLTELTQWLFDEDSAQNVWNTYLLIEDGLYFYWQKDKVFIRPQEQVLKITASRKQEEIEAAQIKNCINNISNNTFGEDDNTYLQEVEKLAVNELKHAKILKHIGVDNTPEQAHQLLLRIKYLDKFFNPYPQRNKIYQDEDIDFVSNKLTRKDLTHLQCFAIDNDNSNDADDAISIDGDKLWIHIADLASTIRADSALDLYAQKRVSNLYLPDRIIHMLPSSVTSVCSLSLITKVDALSLSFCIKDNNISDIEVVQSVINVRQISYTQADKIISTDTHLSALQNIANTHRKYRNSHGAVQLNLPNVDITLHDDKISVQQQDIGQSREMVAEMMILAGRAIAQFSLDNDIAMPYVSQETADFNAQDLIEHETSLAKAFQLSKKFKRSKITTIAAPHAGLGLDAYIRVTSPMRRYLDLVAQQQLISFINGEDTLSATQIKARITITNTVISKVNKASRESAEHFKCLYLMQNKNWRGAAKVVDIRNNKALMLIPCLATMCQIKTKNKVNLDDEITLKVSSVDLFKRLVDFQPA